MVQVRAVSGGVAVVASGTTTTFGGADLVLTVDGPDGRLILRLVFVTDPARPDLAVQADADPAGLTLTLTNFDSADGRGSAHPVLVGALGDDLLLAHFRVFRYGRTPDHTVHWTFYRAPAADLVFADGPGTAPRLRR